MDTAQPVSRGRYVVLILLLIGVSGTTLVEHSSRKPEVTLIARRGAPRELAFDLLQGGTWRLSDERGNVVAVNLWATWCGPCRAETPMLLRLHTDLQSRGFRVVGVSLDTGLDKEAQVRRFQTAFHLTYPLAFPGPLSQIESGLDGIPTTLLFDRQGRAAKVYMGELREASLRADVNQLLLEP